MTAGPLSARRPLIAANWKLNGSLAANQQLLEPVVAALRAQPPACDVVVCVPAPYFAQVRVFQDASRPGDGSGEPLLQMGAQDVSPHAAGAYTGELAARMAQEFGARWAIVGHSERRQYHNETDAAVAAKARAALAEELTPIVCVGETLAEREAGQAEATVRRQLDTVLQAVGADASRLVVAYEPVWAIGTGRSATPEMAQAMHAALRGRLGEAAAQVRILYGGSMGAANAAALLAQPDIDGGLVGSASLQAEAFLAIVAAAR